MKAQGLIREQYAAVSAVASGALPETVSAPAKAATRVINAGALLERFEERAALVHQYTTAWKRYCWPVSSVADLKLAPFHLLASEGAVHTDKDHRWHMERAAERARPTHRVCSS